MNEKRMALSGQCKSFAWCPCIHTTTVSSFLRTLHDGQNKSALRLYLVLAWHSSGIALGTPFSPASGFMLQFRTGPGQAGQCWSKYLNMRTDLNSSCDFLCTPFLDWLVYIFIISMLGLFVRQLSKAVYNLLMKGKCWENNVREMSWRKMSGSLTTDRHDHGLGNLPKNVQFATN